MISFATDGFSATLSTLKVEGDIATERSQAASGSALGVHFKVDEM